MHRKTFLKGLVGAAALAVAGLPALAQDTIKIGEINHYKRMAAFAEPYKMGIELALEEVNAAGGVLGKPLEFIFRDDQGDPVEAIKIDRSFVAGLGIDDDDSTIVEAVVQLGRSLGVTVVAEGVESPLQLSRLRELNCDRGQGYLFGRPRPAEIIVREGVGG